MSGLAGTPRGGSKRATFRRAGVLGLLFCLLVGLGLMGSLEVVRAAGPESGGGKPKRNKNEPQKKENGTTATSPEALKLALKAVRSGDFEKARSMIRAALNATRSTKVKQSWQIVEAELEYELKNYAKSGLIAMRIVILSPESEQVGEALYRAGKAYEKLERPSKALELYEECVSHNQSSERLRKKAGKRIAELKPAEQS